MRLIAAFAIILFTIFSVQAKKSSSPNLETLKQTTEKYRSAKTVQMEIIRTVKSDLTGKENQYKGMIYLSAGLFRIVNSEPEKSLLIFDGSYVWNEQAASPDFPGPPQVTKTKINPKDKSQTVFASLLTKDPVTKNFKIINDKKDGGATVYEAEPLNKEMNVKSLVLKIDDKTKLVSEITYTDDLGNLTVMKFSEAKFKKSFDKSLFQYKPPKGAQVTEI